MFQTKFVHKIKKPSMFNKFHPKSCLLCDNVEKCGLANQATDDNSAHQHCMLHN